MIFVRKLCHYEASMLQLVDAVSSLNKHMAGLLLVLFPFFEVVVVWRPTLHSRAGNRIGEIQVEPVIIFTARF